MKNKKYDMFIEKPISNKNEDLFGIESYADSIKDAIDNDARFIAIDGDFGSGKSSILNIVKDKYKTKNFFSKIKFVDINFLNIDKNLVGNVNLENETSKLSYYHKYFVNQVVNDICKNPYTIEKLFYNSFVSIATTKNDVNRFWKILIDKALLVLISFITIMVTYLGFLKEVNSLKYIKDVFMPLLPGALYITFILIIIYGYGIFKPDKQTQSPMLDIDRSRNNLLKAVQNNLSSKSKLVFVIDDLDRLDPEIQSKIISLLYNEYYPLSGQIRDIDFCFVFMINNRKIIENNKNIEKTENQYDPNKLFDFILTVSSNQKFIVRDYIYNCFSKGNLEEIIEKCSHKEFLIGIIMNNYSDIRSLKHIFNKIINKYRYLNNKLNFKINYDELVLMTVLNDIMGTENLSSNVTSSLLTKKSSINIIQESIENKIIDSNYYLYLYNFSNSQNLLNDNEMELYNLLIKIEQNDLLEQDVIKINEIINTRDDIRLRKIYEEIFIYLSKKIKLILLTNNKFFKFVFSELPKNQMPNYEIFKNLYYNEYAQLIYLNINDILTTDKNKLQELICNKLIIFNDEYINNSSDENYETLEDELIIFAKNLKDSVLEFNKLDLFTNLGFMSDELFNELFEKNRYGWYLYNENIINFGSIGKKVSSKSITNLNLIKDSKIKDTIKKSLLTQNLNYNQIREIIFSERLNLDIKALYIKLSNIEEVPLDDIEKLIDLYGYCEEIDPLLEKQIDKYSKNVYEFINRREIQLSNNLIDKFNSINNKYCWRDVYNEQFVTKGKWNLYIYSKIKRNNCFSIPKKYQKNLDCIKTATSIYCTVNQTYSIDKSMASIFLKEENINKIIIVKPNNKIGQLSYYMTDLNIENVLNKIEEYNLLEFYCQLITSKEYNISKYFLEKFCDKFYDELHSINKRKLTNKLKQIKS